MKEDTDTESLGQPEKQLLPQRVSEQQPFLPPFLGTCLGSVSTKGPHHPFVVLELS